MYKLTFMDADTAAFVSSIVSVFVDNLEEFEKEWIALEEDGGVKNRYFQSKSGIPTTDFHKTDHDEELEIVQHDPDEKVLYETELSYDNITVTAVNGWDFTTPILFEHLSVRLRYIRFQGIVRKLASFSGKGVCRDDDDMADLFERGRYSHITVFGNPFLLNSTSDKRASHTPSDFSENTLSSYVWYELSEFSSEKEATKDWQAAKLTDDELAYLLRDIVGESG